MLMEQTEEIARLLWLRQQLDDLAGTPAVNGAQRLLADVAPVLEPVWSISGGVDESAEAVGFLRRIRGPAETGHNLEVLREVTKAFGAIDLLAPTRRQIWEALARPAQALIASVGDAQGPQETSQYGALLVAPRPRLPSELLSHWSSDSEIVPVLRQVLRDWCDIARHASGERREVAQLTLAAALLTRGAALDGDTATVRWFVDRWLGLAPTDSRVDGTIAALLSDGWRRASIGAEFTDVQDVVTDLRVQATLFRREAKRQHRLHRPVWETQVRGAPVAMLLDTLPGQDSLALVEAIVGSAQNVDDTVANAFLNEHLSAVLDSLSPIEEKVVRSAYLDERTWVQIANDLRMTRYQLDKLRAKIFRKLRHPSRAAVLRDYLD
ncbi:hypothetical protein ACIBEJ_25250 [Nonomuraea sp. NPDC050790]|uniref:hypothetical protein n=1 Tax=Nonomuraea sp. NPDC050790 TaxID=3364371 RepID=UPI0037B43EC5